MTTVLEACEFEDSTNCIWNAQEQGNGLGTSFVDIEGETFYIEAPFECPEHKVPGWLDENGVPTSCVDNNPNPLQPKEDMVVPDQPEIVVPEPIEQPTAPVEISTGVGQPIPGEPQELAVTGTADAFLLSFVGIALVLAGVVLFVRTRKSKVRS